MLILNELEDLSDIRLPYSKIESLSGKFLNDINDAFEKIIHISKGYDSCVFG
jgi:hypothetical protein